MSAPRASRLLLRRVASRRCLGRDLPRLLGGVASCGLLEGVALLRGVARLRGVVRLRGVAGLGLGRVAGLGLGRVAGGLGSRIRGWSFLCCELVMEEGELKLIILTNNA